MGGPAYSCLLCSPLLTLYHPHHPIPAADRPRRCIRLIMNDRRRHGRRPREKWVPTDCEDTLHRVTIPTRATDGAMTERIVLVQLPPVLRRDQHHFSAEDTAPEIALSTTN